MTASMRWAEEGDRIPKPHTGVISKNPRKGPSLMTNGRKYIYVESLYSDKALGIKKRKGYKRK